MDTHMTDFPPMPPHLDAVSRPRAALPGEAPGPHAAMPHSALPQVRLPSTLAPTTSGFSNPQSGGWAFVWLGLPTLMPRVLAHA